MSFNFDLKFECGHTVKSVASSQKRDFVATLLPAVAIARTDGDLQIWLHWLCFYIGIGIYRY
jgi:hypothetical protein